jgi:spore germination cell wall hydrolase CwlJ-like protein
LAETSTPAAIETVKVAVPDLSDPEGEPVLSDSAAELDQADNQTDTSATATAETAPAVRPTGDLAAMVAQLKGAEAGSRELECLATGIYFESKSEPLAGQLAVGKVIANRAASGGRFPPTYCGVLFQRGQFSFVHGGRLPSVPRANKQWQTAVAIARIVDQGLQQSSVGNALFFHARYVAPGWHMKRVAAIGNHVFYR